jgi:hypothetical protein
LFHNQHDYFLQAFSSNNSYQTFFLAQFATSQASYNHSHTTHFRNHRLDKLAVMSHYPSPYSNGEYSHPYFTMLNAEAAPFTPSFSSRSLLRASAPVFVAPVAHMVTPQPPMQPESEAVELQTYGTPSDIDNLGLMQSVEIQSELDWNGSRFSPSSGDHILNFGNNQSAVQYDAPQVTPDVFKGPQPDRSQHFTSIDDLEFNGANQNPVDPVQTDLLTGGLDSNVPRLPSFTGEFSMAFDTINQSAAQSDAPLDALDDHMTPLREHSQQYVGHNTIDFGTADHSEAHIELPFGAPDGSMTPEAEPFMPYTDTLPTPNDSPRYKPYVMGEYDVVPSIERDFDLSALRTPPTSEHGSAMHPPGGLQRLTAPSSGHDEQVVVGDNSDIDGDYDVDDEYQTPAPASPRESVAPSHGHSFVEKQRMANIVIKQQAKENSLAKRLGQDIRVVRKGNRVCFEGVYWNAPQNDDTIPTTEALQYECVKKLVVAMRNNQGCKEVSTAKMFLNRWASDATHYSMEEFESIAWDVVDAMVDIHTKGWTKKLLDQKLRDQVQKTMFCTFAERSDALIKLLTTSKRTCEDLLKSERFWTTIGNPFELDVRTSSNAASNKNKAVKLKRGAGEDLGGRAGKRTKA